MFRMLGIMLFIILFIVIIWFCSSLGILLPASKSDIADNYFLGYQPGLLEYMQKFKMVITDTRVYSKKEIMQLKKNGITVIGYVSLGESAKLEKGDGRGPGGYASWYFDSDNDNFPDQNMEFKSYYADVRNSYWMHEVFDEIKKVKGKGGDGFFLDTVDTMERYPQTRKAMIDLIKSIRKKYPNKLVVQNRGFNIVETTAPYVNAVMWESWYPDSTEQWVINWQNKLMVLKSKYGIDILSLGYYDTYNNLQRYYDESKNLGFIPFVLSDSDKDEVVEFFSTK